MASRQQWLPDQCWAKLYSSQLDESNRYAQLTPAISISLVNFEVFPDLREPKHCILLKHKDHDQVLTDQLHSNRSMNPCC